LIGRPAGVSPIRLFRFSRRAIDPAAMSVMETQFSTSSCSNIPELPTSARWRSDHEAAMAGIIASG